MWGGSVAVDGRAAARDAAERHYDVSTAAIGWLAQLFVLLYVVLAIPAGIALDRNLRRTLPPVPCSLP